MAKAEKSANTTLFLTEVFQKENLNRLRWFEKNYDKVYVSQQSESVPTKAKVLHEELTRRRLEQQKNAEQHLKGKAEFLVPKPNMDIDILGTMRPVPPEELLLLTQGSVPYLMKRYEHSPSDRFYLTETSNWLYGWGAEKRIIGTSDSKLFGHRNIIDQTFPRRNGVQLELPFYRDAATHNFDYPFI